MAFEPSLTVKIWGDFACFTRPEMKVERVSYPIMTPSAARGVLEAIFWKPEMQWRIRRIEVLKPVQFFSILRNEVNSKASVQSAREHEQRGTGYFADDDRAQRHALILREVAYVVAADIVLASHATDENPAKFRDQFRRRVERGQCHHMPYLGCREFSAFFGVPSEEDRPIDYTADVGQMLFDLDYPKEGRQHCVPRFFHARLEHGVLTVPPQMFTGQEA